MSADERAKSSGKTKGPKRKSYISKKDRPDFYHLDKPICEYTIGELATLFQYVEIRIKDLRTKKTLGPFCVRIETSLGARADQELEKFTFQGVLNEFNKSEWTLSDCETEFHVGTRIIMFRKVGVD
jgi:hypothetical protein